MPKSRLKVLSWLERRRMRSQPRCRAKVRSVPISAFATSTKLARCMMWGATAL